MNQAKGCVLVAGGLGYIGSNVVLELVKSGYRVVIADDLSNSSETTLDQISTALRGHAAPLEPPALPDQIVFQRCDLTVLSETQQLFDNYSINAVIAMAGKKAVGESVEQPELYYRVNLNIITNLLQVMREHGCFKLIFSGSSTVYGESANAPFDESMPIGTGITNPYGFTKYLIETILADAAKFETRWQITTLRYFNPVGCRPSGLLADNPRQPLNLIPVIMRSLASGTAFKVFGTDYPTRDGSAERDYIHVTDLANAHVCALEHLATGYHVYNLGLEAPVSVLEVVKCFERVNGVQLNYQITARREGDLVLVYANCDKIKRELGWKPQKSLEDIVRDCYAARRFYGGQHAPHSPPTGGIASPHSPPAKIATSSNLPKPFPSVAGQGVMGDSMSASQGVMGIAERICMSPKHAPTDFMCNDPRCYCGPP